MKCAPCHNGLHCRGTVAKCECGCGPAHTIPQGDPRLDMIAVLTAVTTQDPAIIKQAVSEIEEPNMPMVISLLGEFIVEMLREAGSEPLEVINEAAIYWQGGGNDE